jgi:hypothetical protein
MDHSWAAQQLRTFQEYIDALRVMEVADDEPYDEEDEGTRREALREYESRYGSRHKLADRIVSLDPVMRDLMNAAEPNLGAYETAIAGGWSYYGASYWFESVRYRVLQAIGIHELGEEAKRRMQPDSPDLVADQLHPWVWEAAAPMWRAGSAQEALHAAARSVNARLQQKLGRHDVADAKLCREAFSLDDAAMGKPRLRFSGDRTSETWRSRQNGGIQFGAGCFEGIRNISAHVDGLELTDQVALEQLAAFSVLARWIDECEVEAISEVSNQGQ